MRSYIYKPMYNPVLGKCVLGAQAGPQTIVVRQVLGENEGQKSLDIHVRVPRRKPSIEQVIDVFIRRLRITDVRVIRDKVIVCGDFEVKAIFVACLPGQPVHAVEIRRVRYTVDIPIPGARPGMDADASVRVESVDYDTPTRGRPHWDKQGNYHETISDLPDQEDYFEHHHHPGQHHDCDDKPDHDCGHEDHHGCGHEHHHHDCCFRHFTVSVVLAVNAKVMTDREIVIYPGQYPGLPQKPKG